MKGQDTTAATIRLPLDVLGVVADWLVTMEWHASCAALNVASKAVHEETLPTLWSHVLYRLNNSSSAKKKSAIRWRTTFGSKGVEYIQYLVVIPSHLPEVATRDQSWDPPFISLVTTRRNRLKACIVPGKNGMISFTLYDHYRPCSLDLVDLIKSAQLVRMVKGDVYHDSTFRIHAERGFHMPDLGTDYETLQSAFDLHNDNIKAPAIRMGLAMSFRAIRLLAPSNNAISDENITRLAVDLLGWQGQAAWASSDGGKDFEGQQAPPWYYRIHLAGASYSQAMAYGRAVDAAYAYRESFGALVINVTTRTAITPDQAISFTQVMQRNFLMSSAFFLRRKAGLVHIVDLSKESARTNNRPGMKGVSATMSYRLLPSDESDYVIDACRLVERGGEQPTIRERLFLDRSPGTQEQNDRLEMLGGFFMKGSL